MFAISVIVTSFVAVVLGLLHSHAVKDPRRHGGFLGLTRLGLTILVVSAVGMTAGVSKEVVSAREAAAAKKRDVRVMKLLEEVHTVLVDADQTDMDPEVLEKVRAITKQMADELADIAGSML